MVTDGTRSLLAFLAAPVLVGDLVSCYARIERIGRTSVTVGVEALVTREPDLEQSHKVADASITYVAIDQNRRPRPIDETANQATAAGNSE